MGTVTKPNGFTVVDELVPSLAPGQTDFFIIRLDTTTAGTKSGDISFSNNDGDGGDGVENPFNFRITGTVTLAGTIADFSWQYKTSVPRGSSSVASAVLDGRIYVIGGNPRDVLNRYDPTTDHWDELAPIPGDGIDEGGAAVVNGKIYAVGNPFDSFMRIYDPVTNAWSMGAAMPTPRGWAQGRRTKILT